MKRNILDKMLGFFSPAAEVKRIKARMHRDLALRAYDAAQSYNSDDWTSAQRLSANRETKNAIPIIRDRARDAGRNNPYARKAISAIVGNTVGAGIVPEFQGPARQKKIAKLAWKEWGETPLCDSHNMHNFYSLQSLVLKNVIEAGEVLIKKEFYNDAIKMKVLEADFINSNVDYLGTEKTKNTFQGIELDTSGKVVAYHLYDSNPGEYQGMPKTIRVDAKDVAHIFLQDRPGQNRGVSWFAPVLRVLEDFKVYQDSTLIRQKGAASFMAFITSSAADTALTDTQLREQRALDAALEPGIIRHLAEGEDVKFSNPPAVDGYAEYCRQTLRSVGAGLGVPYEALTGDYSQVNYSSGRMGHLEFRKNVDMWRWQMLIPLFCDRGIKIFLEWAELRYGLDPSAVTVKWTPPAWSMIDPNKEYSALQLAVRNGFMSAPQAILEQGGDPDQTLEEIAEWGQKLDEKKIILDSDPRKTNSSGQAQADPNSNNNGDPENESKEEDAPPGSDQSAN
jgi:lambda family phage portal protein